ncbi:two-component system, response regulator YesN [Lachnospiraceae bacterium NE2001]|nr:two-component system, response regulator YesN [Lachnospiraceae bacterium NE2001]
MLKVMFVDDEPYIVEGLKVLIDWKSEGFEIVNVAENGQEALDFLRDNEVNLVIADIRMPVMTGIELLQAVKEQQISDAYFVVLSGFNDFQYARDAMRLGCLDYLLKPIKKDELLKILRKINALNKENTELKAHHEEAETAYLEQHMVALIVGRYDDANLDYLKKNMRLSNGVRYVIIELPDTDELDTHEGSVMQYRREMNEAAKLIIGEDSNHLIYDVSLNHSTNDTGFIYCDYMADDRGEDDVEFLTSLQNRLELSLKRKVRIISGKKVSDITQVSKSYSSACILKSQEVFHEARPVVTYEREMSINPGKATLFKKSLDNLVKAIEQSDEAEIHKCVNAFYDDISKAGLGDSVSLNMNYLLFQLIHVATELDDELDQEEILHRISESSFDEGIKRGSSIHMYKFACEYAQYLNQLRKNVSGGILKDVEKEIRENYSENLSLKKLSEKYFINCSYLGSLFTKKYGVSFKDYLTDYRINEAAKMLINTDDRIVDISAAVGYKNSDYFIRRFIEIKGMTPSQYRRQKKSKM